MFTTLLLALGTLPATQSALASTVHRAPAALGTVLLHVEPTAARFSPTNSNLTRVGTGQSQRIVLYAYFSGVTAPMTVHVTLTGRRGAKVVFKSVGAFNVGRAQLGGASSGWRWYWNDIGGLTTKPGRLTFTGAISAGGVQQQRTTTLTVA
jgi:hypothetical protein